MKAYTEALFEAPLAHEPPYRPAAHGAWGWSPRAERGARLALDQEFGVEEAPVAGHSLTMPARFRVAPLPAASVADLFNAGDTGHEGIEKDALRPLVGDPRIVEAIYFGNWQRDLSQVIAPAIRDKLGQRSQSVYGLLFEVCDVMAEAKFRRRLDRASFGTYRWEEHIDNPRDYGEAIDAQTYQPTSPPRREDRPEATQLGLHFWQQDKRTGLSNYILASRQYVLRELGRAMQAGRGYTDPRLDAKPVHDRPDLRGFEHFGNAMHTVEDMYAHSNFIELALHSRNPHVDPKTGIYADRPPAPIVDHLGRPRLTTGIFEMKDTVVSLEKLLVKQIEGPEPGAPPSPMGKNVTRVLIKRLLKSETLANTYVWLVEQWERTRFAQALRRIEETVMGPLRRAIADLLRPLGDAAASRTGTRLWSIERDGKRVDVVEISHSLLAKDDPHHSHHRAARELAKVAVADFWRELDSAWARRLQPRGDDLEGTRFRELVDRYMNHPLATGEWWAPILGLPRSSPAPPAPRPPAPRPPTPTGPPVLRRGAAGLAVRTLQQRLNAWLRGVPAAKPLAVDGIFGQLTDGAVRSFQRARSLAVDGVVGSQMWAALPTG